jgi:hypothetical protein
VVAPRSTVWRARGLHHSRDGRRRARPADAAPRRARRRARASRSPAKGRQDKRQSSSSSPSTRAIERRSRAASTATFRANDARRTSVRRTAARRDATGSCCETTLHLNSWPRPGRTGPTPKAAPSAPSRAR